jgi:hypothetical protein
MTREFYVRRVVSGGPESWGPYSNLNDAMEKACGLLKIHGPAAIVSIEDDMGFVVMSGVATCELDAGSWASHNQSSPLPLRRSPRRRLPRLSRRLQHHRQRRSRSHPPLRPLLQSRRRRHSRRAARQEKQRRWSMVSRSANGSVDFQSKTRSLITLRSRAPAMSGSVTATFSEK